MTPSSRDIHPHRMSSEHLRKRDEEIVRLCLEEGLKRKEVAARFDLRPETVSRILARASMHRGQPEAKMPSSPRSS